SRRRKKPWRRRRKIWTRSVPEPFATHVVIGFGGGALLGEGGEFRRGQQLGERPHGGAAHQRRSIVQCGSRGRSERGIAAIADRDHHIAQEAVAADALDRR